MCLFCKIINKEIPSKIIYEDDDFISFLDISQLTKGHCLVLPKKHYENIFDLDPKVGAKLFIVTTKIAKLLKQKLQCEGINVINNSGTIAGQTVMHFHLHLLPRYSEDEFQMISGSPQELNLDEIRKSITDK